MDRLPVDVAGGRAAQESHHGGDIFGAPLFTANGAVRQVMGRFRLVLWTRRADQAGNNAIDGDAVGREIMGECAGEADDAGFCRHHMGAIRGARMRAQAADIDDGARRRTGAAPAGRLSRNETHHRA